MIETLENFSKLFCSVVGKFVFRERQDIDKMAFENSALSDEQLKLQCHLVASGAEIQGKGLKRSFIEWLITIFSSFFGISNPVMLQRLALGVEAFKRVPADLPKGSQLYPQQIEAAMALTQRCIIQMDTGEGKTYALLPAAFALACEHYRVFIVCANEYLAWRDATRTRDYWNYVGLSVGLFTQHSQERELSCRIVYTTLRDLIFHYLRNGISTTKSSYSLHGALLIDEADDVLLDKATQSYHLNQDIRSDAFDWTFAIEYAESLAEGEDVVVDRGELDANLTILGEEKLREALEARALTASSYFLTRFAVEIAYVAVKLVREGTHYIVENDQAYPVDLITGKIDRSITPTWIIPLEYLSGLQARPESVTLDKISGINFLKKFPHLAGLSGTIENDYFEYVYTYFLLPIKIEPRFERHKENIPDYIFAKRNDSLRQLAEEVKAIVSRGRPLLIGTQTITDAEDIYRLLKEALPPATNVNLLTGKNDRDAAEYFERAGQVGQVLIATQLAGRGVDIRLSDEARQNGGLALIGYGHALEPRFDRQFLGRAGRQGDPFTAQFFCSLEDPLFEVFTGENLRQLMGWTGLSGDSAIESPLVSRRLRGAQLNLRRHQFLRRRSMIGLEMLDSEVRLTLESWFSYLQIPYEFLEDRENSSTGQGDEDGRCSQAFVEKVVEEYLTTELEPLLGGKKDLTYKEAEQITIFFKNSVGLENILNPLELEGSNQQIATDKIRKKLKDKIIEAEQKYLSEKVQVSELFFKVAADYSNYQEAKYHAEEERRLASLAEEESQFAREFEAFVDENRADGDDTALDDEGIEGWEVDTFDIFTQPDAAGDEHSLVATNCTAEDEVAVVISPMVSPQIEEELSLAYSEAYEKYELFRKRSPKEIAYWSILTNWMDYLEERERVIHRGYLKGYSFAKFYRVVTDGVLSEWHKKEALIAPDLLRNLLQCDQPATLNELFFPATLNELFFLADNSTINSSKKDNDVAFDWSPGIDNESYLDGAKVSADLLIQQFNAHYHEQIEASDLSLNQMRLLLQNFLSQFPLHTLQNPDRIQKAIENWPTLWEVDRSHKKIRLAWLRTFLLYLRSRDLIGPLPDYRNRVRSFFSRLQERLAEMKTIFSLSGIMAFTTVFIVSSYLGHFAQPKQLGVFGQQVDYLLFGGFLSEGIFTAPSLAVLILATTLTHILFPGASDQSPGTGFDRVLAPLLQVAFAIWLTDWSYGNSLTIRALHATAVFLAIFLFFSDSAVGAACLPACRNLNG